MKKMIIKKMPFFLLIKHPLSVSSFQHVDFFTKKPQKMICPFCGKIWKLYIIILRIISYVTMYCLLYLIQETLKNRLTLISFNMYLSNNICFAFIDNIHNSIFHVDSILVLLIDNWISR